MVIFRLIILLLLNVYHIWCDRLSCAYAYWLFVHDFVINIVVNVYNCFKMLFAFYTTRFGDLKKSSSAFFYNFLQAQIFFTHAAVCI